MSERWSRRNVFVTLVVGLLAAAVPLGIYIHDFQSREIGTQIIESSETSETSLPTVSISSIHVSEVALDIPAVFEMGIQVDGTSNLSAQDLEVILDFGRAETEICGYTPKSAVIKVINDDKSYRRLEIAELGQKEKLYIRCFINLPIFEKVTIKGGNIFGTKSIDFEQYQVNLQSEPIGFWRGLGVFFVIFFSAMFCFKVVGFLFD